MNATNYIPGRYCRSTSEAERELARNVDVRNAMRRGSTAQRNAARIMIELSRRGYLCDWLTVASIATTVDAVMLDAIVIELATKIVEAGAVRPEDRRDDLVEQWGRPAADLGDTWADDVSGEMTRRERSQVQLRYWGMLNRAMRDRLERGECVDLSQCARTLAGSRYIVPAHVFQEDIDYCDAELEDWIRSIGRRTHGDGFGQIHASTGNDLYLNDNYHCLWLR